MQLTSESVWNRDDALIPDGKADTFFYSARKMSESTSSLTLQPLKPEATAKKAYTDTGLDLLSDVSTDGKWGAWIRMPARTKATALIVDIETGKEKVLYPSSGDVRHTGAPSFRMTANFYVRETDGGGDQALVLSFETPRRARGGPLRGDQAGDRNDFRYRRRQEGFISSR